ncbi:MULTISPECIES: pantoate--beta-alanine ligase [Paenibacillus]|uniref:Pantothenate synthetase n=1 Tax=Paenibacillus campinasensis TaxID=66347 RepID=A0ABW9SVN0_9BACL|nr:MULTISPECIES: pantoate--beta-alanine ligase [Paenibacillus]MUG65040.1 pantoate--beta-alanine ligase [Paenibacillus campinasensis]PAK53613.1 pantoate--beta-alanine ligase [Paenibacillus sp. 7541]
MKVIRTIEELRSELRERTRSGHEPVGLVPTMGYLHEGHASLMRKAREMTQTVVLSIFVNPIQFGPGEDYETYPRDEARDLELARAEGVDIVFIPTVEVMYPQPIKTKVSVADITSLLCGASRPGHFDGVTTVVSKLFHIVKPDYAFFGMKDAQQVAVIEQMVRDLSMDITIVPCPIVREADGLALSSRNVYLKPEERRQALVLSRSLQKAREAIASGQAETAGQIRQLLRDTISEAPLADIDYVEAAVFPELDPLQDEDKISDAEGRVLLALAVRFGRTRLIDNTLI